MTASSFLTRNGAQLQPWFGRLYGFDSWIADDDAPWIQVDFTTKVVMKGIFTKGSSYRDYNDWVTMFKVQTGDSNDDLKYIMDGTMYGTTAKVGKVQKHILHQ